MTILQYGNIDKYKDCDPWSFVCCKCGCIWIAFKDEYEIEEVQLEQDSIDILHSMKCPTCGTKMFGMPYKEYKNEH